MTAAELARKTCVPCEGGVPTLTREEIGHLLPKVPGWQLAADGGRITRTWRAADFAAGLEFFRRVGAVAEAEGHHPDLHLTDYRTVRVDIRTHAVGGLTENDFILAAKISELEPPRAVG